MIDDDDDDDERKKLYKRVLGLPRGHSFHLFLSVVRA